MTTNRRAKQDARARKNSTGEPYTVARRRSSAVTPRHFEPDHCANCLVNLPQQIERLFCSELCRQTAEVVRYWRGITRDGRIDDPDVKLALMTRVAHILAGGYDVSGRRLSREVRAQVWERDQGRCRECGQPGHEIDHIHDSSPALTNLQLLCMSCHRRKTALRMVPAEPEQTRAIADLSRTRVMPEEPAMLCDDRDRWATVERQLRKERRQRLLAELADLGYQRTDFPGRSWAEMWTEVLDDECDAYADAMDDGGWTPDDDTGYGPYSYFAHAMAKDD